MSEDFPISNEQQFKQVEYAGFWLRVGAYLTDYIVLFILEFIVALLLKLIFDFAKEVMYVILSPVNWLYLTLMESSKYQATIGKMAVGIKVTDLHGERVSFGKANGRFFAKILSVLILFFGFFMIGWTQKKQGLHDFMANTLVVKK